MRLCLIPAAGVSRRMRGGDKLLEPVGDKPCLQVLVERARQAGADVIVTLPSLSHPRADAVASLDAKCIAVPDAHLGMSSSLKAGARAVPKAASGLMILPGDMPAITAADMSYLWQQFEELHPPAVQATTSDGQNGHPIIFAPTLLPDFERLQGDKGAYGLLNDLGNRVLKTPLHGDRARMDLDTPEDWAAWRVSIAR